MKRWLVLIVAGVVALALVGRLARHTRPPRPYGVPIAAIASGQPAPRVGLIGPFPAWAPLPGRGLVVGAELFRPQPPYGASAVIMLVLDDSFDGFAAAYGQRLAQAGFVMRRLPIGPNLIIDRPVAQFEADERQGGHVVYVTFRGNAQMRYVQLTFWAPPAPHIGDEAVHALWR